MKKNYYVGLVILIFILIVVLGLKMSSKIEFTNTHEVNDSEQIEREYIVDKNINAKDNITIIDGVIYEDVTKKDKKSREAVVSINQEEIVKHKQKELKDIDIKVDKDINIKNIKDEINYK